MMRKGIVASFMAFCSMLMLVQAVFAAPAAGHPSAAVQPQPLKPIQVFDVAAGKVIKSIPNDEEFQKFAATALQSITGLAPQMTTDKNCNYVFRIPLAEPAMIKVNGIDIYTKGLFLFYCKDKPPALLVFDQERKPYLLQFSADIEPFLKRTGVVQP